MASPRPKNAPDEKLAAEVMKHFLKMDSDGDGQLSVEEFRSGLGSLGMDQSFVMILFNSFDKDGDGVINKKEFLTAMAVMLHPNDQEEQISMAFDAYDSNKDGQLQVEELRHVIGAVFATMEKMGIRDDLISASAERTADDLFRTMDRDNKGYVTKSDYMRLATENPDLLKKVGLGNAINMRRQPSRVRSHVSSSQLSRSEGSLYGVPKKRENNGAQGGKANRKRGTTISFGHDNWELVVQMMLAIRLSVGRARLLGENEAESSRRSTERKQGGATAGSAAGAPSAAPVPDESGKRTTTRPRLGAREATVGVGGFVEGSEDCGAFILGPQHYRDVWYKQIPGHSRGKDTTIGFKDYAPLVFRRVRQLFGISDSDYMLSLGPEQILGELLLGTMGSLSELFSEGKSGSFFYFSNDGRYLIKTIPHRELLSLINLLPQYVAHVEEQPHTLLPRFMGAHRLKLPDKKQKIHFIVMTNVFSTSRVIHHRYDLKGSTQGRTAGKATLAKFPDVVRKDLDIVEPFHLKPESRDALKAQAINDLHFLRTVYTMDYSMLVGVHFPNLEAEPEGAAEGAAAVPAAPSHVHLGMPSSSSEGVMPPGEPTSPSPSPPSDAYPSATSSEAGGPSAAPSVDRAPAGGSVSGGLIASALRMGGGGLTTEKSHASELSSASERPSELDKAFSGIQLDLSSPSKPAGPTTMLSLSQISHVSQAKRGGGNASWRGKGAPPWVDYPDGAMDAAFDEAAAAAAAEANGGTAEGNGQIIYFIGIIDILTAWTCLKAAENWIKRIQHPHKPLAHSCVPPLSYADRFERAMRKWFA